MVVGGRMKLCDVLASVAMFAVIPGILAESVLETRYCTPQPILLQSKMRGGEVSSPLAAAVDYEMVQQEPVIDDEGEPDDMIPICSDSQKVLCEGVGTFLLALAAACAGAQDTPLGPLAVASVLIGLIYSFGKLSGAVFNPAVSIALIMRGRMDVETALRFAAVQTAAAFLAGLAGWTVYGKAVAPAIRAEAVSAGIRGLLRAGFSEVLFTGIIATAVCHAGTHPIQASNDVVGLAIGLTVFGCIICADYSGACFNPAIGLGLQLSKALLGGGFPLDQAILYQIAPPAGAVISTLVFQRLTCPGVE